MELSVHKSAYVFNVCLSGGRETLQVKQQIFSAYEIIEFRSGELMQLAVSSEQFSMLKAFINYLSRENNVTCIHFLQITVNIGLE